MEQEKNNDNLFSTAEELDNEDLETLTSELRDRYEEQINSIMELREIFKENLKIEKETPSLTEIKKYLKEKELDEPTEQELEAIHRALFVDIPTVFSIEETLFRKENIVALHRVLSEFPEKFGSEGKLQEQVIRMTFGINDKKRLYSIDEITKALGLHKGRIRELRKQALKRLRFSLKSEGFIP